MIMDDNAAKTCALSNSGVIKLMEIKFTSWKINKIDPIIINDFPLNFI